MYVRVSKYLSRFFALAFVVLIPVALAAQVTASPTHKAPMDDSASKWDIFLGYSFLAPNATVYGWNAGPRGTVGAYQSSGVSIMTQKLGSTESLTRFYNRHFGLQLDSGQHDIYNGSNNGSSNSGMYTVQAGGIYRWPGSKVTPWVHVLGGGAVLNGPSHQGPTPGWTTTAGGGLDYELNRHWAIRMVEADYEFVNVRYGLPHYGVIGWQPGGTAQLEGIRLAAGVVYHMGSIASPAPVTLACSASPTMIYAGDPVTLTAAAGGLNPRMNVVYTWSGSGVSGNGTTVAVATGSLAPGSYTVKCGVKEGRAGREGLKPWEIADSSASFTVRAFAPPTVNCSASPDTIKPGETSNITAAGLSPQNRPLTYSYTATSGTLNSSGAAAVFSSTGAPTGVVGITCTVSDDKGLTATANTSVTIMAPYVAPAEPPEVKQLETRLALHSVFFQTDQPRIEHPNGGLLVSQEGTLTTLASDFQKYLVFKPNAYLTLTGHADIRGSVEYNQALSERRVARTKQFLVEQGVPEAKIQTSGLGKEQNLTASQVKEMVEQNPDLSATERGRVLHELGVIVWAQNRRVDVTLSTTGEQSVRLYPFNAADSLTLIDQRNLTQRKKAVSRAKK
jgi:outer membrane protein OmpA-like peptidoglycan-associated protein